MGLNLLRFLAWQSPLVIPLALVGLFAGRSRNATIVDLAAGIVLTLGVVLVLMPFQGHGWGYRYLHGFLGSLSLIAAQGWIHVTERDAAGVRKPSLALSSSAAALALRAAPLARLSGARLCRAIRIGRSRRSSMPAPTWSSSIPRTSGTARTWSETIPFLRASPKVLSLLNLDEAR